MALNTDSSFPPSGPAPYSINRDWCIGDSLVYINLNSANFDSRIETVSSLVLGVSSYAVGLSARSTPTVTLNFNNLTNVLSAEVVNNSIDTTKLGGNILQSGKALLTAASLSALRDVSIGTLTNNQALVWNSSNNRWENQTVATGAGVTNGDKTDIVVSGTPEGSTWLLKTDPGFEAVQTANTRNGAMTPAKLSQGAPFWTTTGTLTTNFIGVNVVTPNERLTVSGNISATGTVSVPGGNSNQWNSTFTTVQNNSAQWASNIDTGVRSLTSNWESTYTTVRDGSASWASNIDTGVRQLTSNWQNTSTVVQTNSAQWASNIDTGVRQLTSNWQNTSTVVQTNSAQWASNIDTGVRQLTSNWQSTFTTVQSNSGNWGQRYQPVTTSFGASADTFYLVNTTSGALTGTLPSIPLTGDSIQFADPFSTWNANLFTVNRNGNNIESLAENLFCNVAGSRFTLIFVGGSVGWKVYQ